MLIELVCWRDECRTIEDSRLIGKRAFSSIYWFNDRQIMKCTGNSGDVNLNGGSRRCDSKGLSRHWALCRNFFESEIGHAQHGQAKVARSSQIRDRVNNQSRSNVLSRNESKVAINRNKGSSMTSANNNIVLTVCTSLFVRSPQRRESDAITCWASDAEIRTYHSPDSRKSRLSFGFSDSDTVRLSLHQMCD